MSDFLAAIAYVAMLVILPLSMLASIAAGITLLVVFFT